MSNLLNFFFSFDKLMKEKLVIAFYWLAIIVGGANFASEALDSVGLDPIAWLIDVLVFFGTILLSLVTLRLLCEIAVAIFRINNNLSPDGGTSETADIDPLAEAKKAAENAAERAMDLSKSAIDKTKSAAEHAKDSVEDLADNTVEKTRSVAKRATSSKGADVAQATKTEAKPAAKKTPARKPAPKKPTAKKTTAAKTTPPKKTGPKSEAPRLKKDGTPAKKPGPKND